MMDTRHKKRIETVQHLFSYSFNPQQKTEDSLTLDIIPHLATLDRKINDHIDKFSVDKIARVDLAILRLAVYELLLEKKAPAKVVINEAVELAKELGGERSYSFVNGVLGKIYQDKNHEKS